MVRCTRVPSAAWLLFIVKYCLQRSHWKVSRIYASSFSLMYFATARFRYSIFYCALATCTYFKICMSLLHVWKKKSSPYIGVLANLIQLIQNVTIFLCLYHIHLTLFLPILVIRLTWQIWAWSLVSPILELPCSWSWKSNLGVEAIFITPIPVELRLPEVI